MKGKNEVRGEREGKDRRTLVDPVMAHAGRTCPYEVQEVN